MELSSPKPNKISEIFPKKYFSYISGGNFPIPKNQKIIHSEKISYESFLKIVLSTFRDDC